MRRTMLVLLAASTLGAPRLDAQDSARVAATGDKSPMAARVIGIIPGAGHMYAGETGRGLAYMGGTVGIFLIGATAMLADCYDDLLGTEDNCESSNTGDFAAAAVLAFWGWSIYDAGRAAHRTNAKRRQMRVSLILAPRMPTSSATRGGRGVTVGLSVPTAGWAALP